MYKIKILIFLVMLIVVVIDMKKRIISDACLVLLIFLGIIFAINNNSLKEYFIEMGLFQLPLLLLYSLEDYFNKELIGFGDIKLVGVIGGILGGNVNMYENRMDVFFLILYEFYKNLYLISGIFILFYFFINKNVRNKYVPFAPFIAIAYFMQELM